MHAAGSRNSRSDTQFGSMLMKTQPPQVSTLTSERRCALFSQRALPVLLVEDVDVLAFQIVGPAMEAADETLLRAARAILARRRADQPAAAMRAHIVISLERIGRGAHDDDRVIADLVGDEAADLGNFFDAAGHLPHLRPQSIGLGLARTPRERNASVP